MSRLLIHESPLQLLPSLAVKIGLNEAIILQQLHYWLNPDHNKNIHEGLHWVYNSYEQWQKQFPFWSKETIKRAIHCLEKMNLILSRKLNEDKFDHRKWYSINYETLQQLEDKNDRSGQVDITDYAIVHDRSGQNDPIGQVKLTPSDRSSCSDHYKEQRLPSETTTETLSERARVVEQTLEVWNKTFEASVPVQRNAFRETKLSMILFSHFNNDLNQWQQFCERVRASSFLQGKGPRGWRASLDWCVEEVNLFKILEGNYQDADSGQTSSPSLDHSLSQAQTHVEALSDPQHQALAQKLSLQLGPNTYNSWFQDMQLQYQAEGRVVLLFATRFKCDYVKTNYLNILESLVKELLPDHPKLDLAVGKDTAMPADRQINQGPPQGNAEATPVFQQPMLSMVKELTRQLTQSNFRSSEAVLRSLDASKDRELSCDVDLERTPS
ncbi:MAG: DnaA N-terminal domain-containing protein [Janthinobacterium lividum]